MTKAKTKKSEAEQPPSLLSSNNLGNVRFAIESLSPMILYGLGNRIDAKVPTPEQLFQQAIEPYLIPGCPKTRPEIRIPGVWFKAMLVKVADQHLQSLKRATAYRAFYVLTDWIILKHSAVKMHKDLVALPPHSRNHVIRYRGRINTWSCGFTVRFYRDLIDERGLATLVKAGGSMHGFGHQRPQMGGNYGQFQLKRFATSRKKTAQRKAA